MNIKINEKYKKYENTNKINFKLKYQYSKKTSKIINELYLELGISVNQKRFEKKIKKYINIIIANLFKNYRRNRGTAISRRKNDYHNSKKRLKCNHMKISYKYFIQTIDALVEKGYVNEYVGLYSDNVSFISSYYPKKKLMKKLSLIDSATLKKNSTEPKSEEDAYVVLRKVTKKRSKRKAK